MRDLAITHFLQWDLALPEIKHILLWGILSLGSRPADFELTNAKILGGMGQSSLAFIHMNSNDYSNSRNFQNTDVGNLQEIMVETAIAG